MPVLFLSGCKTVQDRLKGFKARGDDFTWSNLFPLPNLSPICMHSCVAASLFPKKRFFLLAGLNLISLPERYVEMAKKLNCNSVNSLCFRISCKIKAGLSQK